MKVTRRVKAGLSIAVLAALTGPAVLVAQDRPSAGGTAPASQPSRMDGPRGGQWDDRRPGGWRERGLPWTTGPATQPTEQEMQQLAAFMQQHSPNRSQAMQKLPEGRWRGRMTGF